jgi:hypothetical protein
MMTSPLALTSGSLAAAPMDRPLTDVHGRVIKPILL